MPTASDRSMSLGAFVLTLLRLRGDKECWSNIAFRRMLKRTVHVFCQAAEEALDQVVLETCPNPEVASRYHPFTKASRLRGNKSLEMNMVSKFMVRGGGYVSLKGESSLSDLGVVSKKAGLGNRTSSEFVVRTLTKTTDFLNDLLPKQDMKTVNFCFDAATVCHEQAVAWQGLKWGAGEGECKK